MADSENLLQKAFYLGVGIAGLAIEKANDTFQELKKQAEGINTSPDFPQKLQQMADEMVNKGKMSTEEARRFIEEMLQQQKSNGSSSNSSQESSAPRTIDIIVDDDDLLSEMLKMTLELEGFAVATAPNGADGIANIAIHNHFFSS